jgi:hypothetical protein
MGHEEGSLAPVVVFVEVEKYGELGVAVAESILV